MTAIFHNILSLTDAFLGSTEKNALESKVRVININSDKAHDILKKCRVLKEYSLFIDTVRKYANGILTDYLKRKGSEVTNMLIGEYSYEEDMQVKQQEAREEAIEEVWGEARKEIETAKKEAETAKAEAGKYSRLIISLTEAGKADMIIKIAMDDALQEKLYKEYDLYPFADLTNYRTNGIICL